MQDYPTQEYPSRITPETFAEAEARGKTAHRAAFMFSPKCYQRIPVIECELWSGDYICTQTVDCLPVQVLYNDSNILPINITDCL